MSRELGLTQDWPVVIVGVGNLGHALANYGGFGDRGFPVAALVDADPQGRRHEINGITVRHIDELPDIAAEHQIAIGIIATPAAAAQDVADRLVAAGVSSILNFAPTVITVPPRGLAAQGRPGGRAADPQLLPAARREPTAPAACPRPRLDGPARGLSVPVEHPLYPVNLVVDGRPCLVVGGGRVALGKVAGPARGRRHGHRRRPGRRRRRSPAMDGIAVRAPALPPGRGRRLPAGRRRHRRPRRQPGRSTTTARPPASGSTAPTTPSGCIVHPARPHPPGPAHRHGLHRAGTARRWLLAAGSPGSRDRPGVRPAARPVGRSQERGAGPRVVDRGARLASGARFGDARPGPGRSARGSQGAPAGVSVVVIGLNHRTVPLDLLERMTVGDGSLPKALHDLCTRPNTSARRVVLSTCNRTEVYVVAERFHGGLQRRPRLPRRPGRSCRPRTSPTTSTSTTTPRPSPTSSRWPPGSTRRCSARARSSARSAGVGAGARARARPGRRSTCCSATPLEVGKRARTETGIARDIASVSQAAVAMAAERLGGLAGRTRAGRRRRRHGRGHGRRPWPAPARPGSSSPTARRAGPRRWPARIGGEPVPLVELPGALAEVDVLLTSTGSRAPIVERGRRRAGHGRPPGARCSSSTSPCPATSTPASATLAGRDPARHGRPAALRRRRRGRAPARGRRGRGHRRRRGRPLPGRRRRPARWPR